MPFGAYDATDAVTPPHLRVEAIMDLTAADRCDACQSQAWVRVWLNADALSILDFCAHHFSQHEARLTAAGAVFADFRDRINAKLDVSA